MYLILKAHCEDELFDGPEAPDVAVIDLEKHRPHLEACSRAVSDGKMSPGPVSVTFSAKEVTWLPNSYGAEECDFYLDIADHGIALVKHLLKPVGEPDSDDDEALRWEAPYITIYASNPTAFILEAEIKNTATTMYTDQFDIEDLDRLEPHDGVVIEHDTSPSR